MSNGTMQPGDALLYRPSTIFGWIIALKTWTKISHIEIYIGNQQTVASRDGVGVGIFNYRPDHLARILRPAKPFNLQDAMRWFSTVNGQKYDYWGLLIFALARRKGADNKMFCSEFADEFYHAGGFSPFSTQYASDRISPAQFLQSSEFTEVWNDGKFALRERKLSHE